MACLNKLAIRGIRSFDDKQISVIEFFSPVTVIVGHNGSGKTTIIECLKYATTGDQPPNTRGGAFIHDPKMANEKEVKAQVKLRFNAANGTRMLAVRNLSVTMKKNGAMTMKTLESILAVADSIVDKGAKVCCSIYGFDIRVLNVYIARRDIDQMCGDGCRNPTSSRRLQSRAGKCHILPSGGLLLALGRTLDAQEEV